PFPPGLLMVIGEPWEEGIGALGAITPAHRRLANIQGFLAKNSQRKRDTKVALHPEPPLDDMLRTIAAARLILNPEISLQAPPNLHQRHMAYLDAGINDWGGISPVTIDFINPQHDWPEIRALGDSCAAGGFDLTERLTVYPRFIEDRSAYLDPVLAGRIRTMARADGLARQQTLEAAE
ncbi:MAG: 7,8-didemethyl-8-hydroxy-5-deazariboflavin synthase subunit CofG, partial [Paracoccaceae bacterium]